jgi:hypothetical protein
MDPMGIMLVIRYVLHNWHSVHEIFPLAQWNLDSTLSDSVSVHQLSIADIKTASVIDHLINLCGDDVQITEELTPAIMAVKSNLEKNPAYEEWRGSEQYQRFTAANLRFFGF